jgi:hypothetical protein
MAVNTTKVEHSYHPGAAMAVEALADLSFTAASQIVVELELAGAPGVRVPLEQDADYALTLPVGATWGTVRALAPYAAGDWLHARRVTPRTQEEEFSPFNVSATAIERMGDKAQRIDQEQDGEIRRALLVPRGEVGATLPTVAARRNKLAWFNDTAAATLTFIGFDTLGQMFKGDPGGNAMSVGLFAALSGLSIPVGTDAIRTSGYGAVGTGSALYSLVPPANVAALPAEGQGVWWKTSLNGRTFQLAEPEPDLFQYGAVVGGDISVIMPIADRHVMRTDSTLRYPAVHFTGDVILGGLPGSKTRIRATRPSFAADDSKLENGSILRGTLWVKSLHHEIVGLGVDHGSAWFGATTDVFKVSPYIDGTGAVAGTFSRLIGCVALGAARSGSTHGFLGENLNNGIIDDIEGCKNLFAVALKMVRCQVGLIKGRKASPAGGRNVLVKADAQFGGGGSNAFATLVSDGAGDATYGVSILLQGNQQMERFAIGTIISFGALNPVAVEVEAGSVLNDFFLNDIIAVGSGGNVNNAALILNGNIANAKINGGVLKPSATARGFAFSDCTKVEMSGVEIIIPAGGLLSQAGNVKNVSSTFFQGVIATQNGDLGVPGFINYDDAGGGLHYVDGLSRFIPIPVGAAKPPLRPSLVSAAMPAADWYNAGEFVRKSTLVADGNNMAVMGWSRITSSDVHVAGTDWRAAYVSLVSPAT